MTMDPGRLEAPVGATVVLTVENPASNRFAHDLQLDGIGTYLAPLAPGRTDTVEFAVPYEGRFMFWCTLENGDHHARGMMAFLHGTAP